MEEYLNKVDSTWKYTTSDYDNTYFNPATGENFTIQQSSPESEALQKNLGIQFVDPVESGFYTPRPGSDSRYVPTSLLTGYNPDSKTVMTINQMAINEQLAQLQNQYASGQLTETQATSLANQVANPTNEAPPTGITSQPQLPVAQAPTNVADISNDFTTPNIPNTDESYGNPSTAIAGTTGMDTYLKTLMEQNADYEKQRVEMEKARQEENQTFLQKLLSTTTSPMDARNDAWQDTGITPLDYFAEEKAKIAEIGALSQEYNAAKAAMEQQIAATQDKLGSMNFINNQVAQITRNAAPTLNMISANINAKAATLQALQGRFNEAQNYVNQAVQDATADFKYKMDVFSTFYQMNQDSINRLDSIYSDAFKTSMNLATMAYEQQVKNKETIGQLMLSYPKAGISMADTVDQAYAKAGLVPQTSGQIIGTAETGYRNVITDSQGNVISSTPITSGTSSSSGGGTTSGTTSSGSTIKFSSTKIETAAREDAVSYLQDIKAGKMTLQEAYDEMRLLYSPKEISDGAIQSLLGIKPVPTTTTTSGGFTLTGGNLKVGSTGDNVKQLQTLLGITADGIFGTQTKNAVIAFQQKNGLTADGIVGPATAAKLAGTATTTSNTPTPYKSALSPDPITNTFDNIINGVNNFFSNLF